ncbi:DNA-directed RNA polymerase III complex subunit Rpc17 [Schizosaccharomyces japonicus yFS275]|uniref:DNA-directed RNA polymerase III subunit RPC9 n=1 Tax=Schizosaccharomyces japonicus (strain yFS275 / FY16936) TaxID=402676 RepID=B6K353_SCHJY|nr:DNA-directed RNA polymerase III complex subunit Rpc17 [Schizosaccharomyces japonicus yFS275]EEB07910.1 DNA-directed RNA polymerase III complex subunit Rpc17 [Schizosaccharomyces japonicus yFS275]
MKVLEARCAYLTNAEVFQYIRQMEEEQNERATKRGSATALVCENLRTVQFELLKYLRTLTNSEKVDEKTLLECIEKLAPFNLTKAERLMIINNKPSSQPEIYGCVEDIENRLTDEQVNKLVEAVASFP